MFLAAFKNSKINEQRLTNKHHTIANEMVKYPRKEQKKQKKYPSYMETHPASIHIHRTQPNFEEFKKFATQLYQGLFYAVHNLKGPSQEFLEKKSLRLPEKKGSTKKFLMLDLDETLIHSVFTNEETDVSFEKGKDVFKFNIRPHCLEFLTKMSQYFEVYVFTASTVDYAEPIIEYLNRRKKTIEGVLHRKHCMETNNGFRIKDLRIIKNRDLKDIILVDNLLHCFALHLENGIPILDFTNNKEDVELVELGKLLIEVAHVPDVRPFLRDRIRVRKLLEIDQEEYLNWGVFREHSTNK